MDTKDIKITEIDSGKEIILIALTNLPLANANKFTDCIDNCDKYDGGLTKLLCYAVCAALDIFAK